MYSIITYDQNILCFISTGSGDIDTSTVVKTDADGCICGASGW